MMSVQRPNCFVGSKFLDLDFEGTWIRKGTLKIKIKWDSEMGCVRDSSGKPAGSFFSDRGLTAKSLTRRKDGGGARPKHLN